MTELLPLIIVAGWVICKIAELFDKKPRKELDRDIFGRFCGNRYKFTKHPCVK